MPTCLLPTVRTHEADNIMPMCSYKKSYCNTPFPGLSLQEGRTWLYSLVYWEKFREDVEVSVLTSSRVPHTCCFPQCCAPFDTVRIRDQIQRDSIRHLIVENGSRRSIINIKSDMKQYLRCLFQEKLSLGFTRTFLNERYRVYLLDRRKLILRWIFKLIGYSTYDREQIWERFLLPRPFCLQNLARYVQLDWQKL